MPRGKKTPPELVYKIMTSWTVTDNYKETARELSLPYMTVKDIVVKNKDKPEFVKLREEKREAFSAYADRIIKKAMKRLEKDIDDEDKCIPVNQLTVAIGTLFDKKALADGKPTERTEFVIEGDRLNKIAELAGYERKQ